jgi:hypothetical protein
VWEANLAGGSQTKVCSKSEPMATQEAEVRRIVVQGQPEQKARLYLKNTIPRPPPTHTNKKGLVEWLKWQSACFARVKP